MYFVDDVHALFHLRGGVDRLVAQRAHAVYAVVRRRVQLYHVQKSPALDAEAARAAVAGVAVFRVLAVDRAREDLRAGRLACAACAGEEVGVRQPPIRYLALQGLGDMLLADHVGKGFGTPLAVKRLIHPQPSLFDKNTPPYTAAEPASLRHMDGPA